MTHPHGEFNPDRIPLAYFITFRAHGTWLHGDERGPVDRFRNRYGSPLIPANRPWLRYNQQSLATPQVKLTAPRGAAVDEAIRETCEIRKWGLWARSVRTNHVHVIVTALCDSASVLTVLKANATRKMREAGCWQNSRTPWARKGSKRRLWTHEQLMSAIMYVEYEQGEPL